MKAGIAPVRQQYHPRKLYVFAMQTSRGRSLREVLDLAVVGYDGRPRERSICGPTGSADIDANHSVSKPRLRHRRKWAI